MHPRCRLWHFFEVIFLCYFFEILCYFFPNLFGLNKNLFHLSNNYVITPIIMCVRDNIC